MASPTEALAAVERLTDLVESVIEHDQSLGHMVYSGWTEDSERAAEMKMWTDLASRRFVADLALLLALLKEAGKVVGPFARLAKNETWIPVSEPDEDLMWDKDRYVTVGHFRAAAKLAELLPSMEGE